MKFGWKLPVVALAGITMSAGIYTQVGAQTKPGVRIDLSRKVTKTFTNAKLDEVLSWLKSQGLSFVVRDGVVKKDARLTLSVVDQPLENVVESIARAFDSQWTHEGKVWVLRPGTTVFWSGDALRTDPFSKISPKARAEMEKEMGSMRDLFKAMPDIKVPDMNLPELKIPEIDLKEMHVMPPMDLGELKALEKLNLKGLKDGDVKILTDEDLKKNPELKKQLDELQKKAEAWGEQFGEKWSKQWEAKGKEWEAWAEKFSKQWEGKEKDWEAYGKKWEEFGQRMEAKAKEIEKFVEEWKKKHGDKDEAQLKAEIEKRFGKDFQFEFGKALDDKALADTKEWALRSKELAEKMKADAGNWTILREGSIKDLLSSLTDGQKATMKDRGYLTPSDLNDAQRKLINLPTSGDWSISYTIDGSSVTIKSK